MANLEEKTVIITGANSGLGFCTAREFGRVGARVWLACHNPSKAKEALTQLREQVPEGDFKVGKLDLSDLASLHDFSQEVLAELISLLTM
ncbi:hypothetical protein K7432_018395 [Basidiobolus ranarum]|uniref:Uncharacterized protein n=1 Tax=Basidiobolus ranarum TaxID=34480 RepID=A0ABR2WCA0_9FUNG